MNKGRQAYNNSSRNAGGNKGNGK